jgi:NTE family protein
MRDSHTLRVNLIGSILLSLWVACGGGGEACAQAKTQAGTQARPGKFFVRPRVDVVPGRPDFGTPAKATVRPKVGLVLSGGGARGIAQIGVLRELEAAGIQIDFVAATSIGGVVGGLYAAGWTPAELESLTIATRWDDVLTLADETERSNLFVDQKQARDRSFLVIRFDGLSPVLPPAVSSGQRFTDMLSMLVLRAPYHPDPDFDALKIPFRAVATDLVSGARVILSSGSLAEAIRAGATVPLLFNPIERDSMRLVDGGLLSNIPVDVARGAGCDIVIAVNSTSRLRTADEMEAPWETADQIMGIMMQSPNAEQLGDADIVITPEVGAHLSTDFSGLDTLIERGRAATRDMIPALLALYEERRAILAGLTDPDGDSAYVLPSVSFAGGAVPDSLARHILSEAQSRPVSLRDIRDHVDLLYETGRYSDAVAEVEPAATPVVVRYVVTENPILRDVRCSGCQRVTMEQASVLFSGLIGEPLVRKHVREATERLLREYRNQGYALARVDSTAFDATTGVLTVHVREGIIGRIDVTGNLRAKDWIVRREFPLGVGDVFEIERARQGVANISATGLFEYVYLEVDYHDPQPTVTIRVKEHPSQIIHLGVRVDNERSIQGMLDLRDENLFGSGMEVGGTVAGGARNLDMVGEYKIRRLFHTYITAGISGFYRQKDSYLYADAPVTNPDEWRRDRVGEYRTFKSGVMVSIGSQLERLGTFTVDLIAESDRIVSIENAAALEESNQLRLIRVGTVVDTKNRYPFPTSGTGLNLSYEFSLAALGGDVGYNALRLSYESYVALAEAWTLYPRVTVGFGDGAMPLSQQFSLGGQESFMGLREDDSRGRQLLLLNLGVRYRLPFTLLFDAYAGVRYDLGTISAVPQEIKSSTLRHGLGASLGFDTPVGPAVLALGRSFTVGSDSDGKFVQLGPYQFYFFIGYRL